MDLQAVPRLTFCMRTFFNLYKNDVQKSLKLTYIFQHDLKICKLFKDNLTRNSSRYSVYISFIYNKKSFC